jgi:hypothetical protein
VRAKAAGSDDDGEGLIADAITLNVDNGTKTDAKGDLSNFPLSAGTLAALKQKCECPRGRPGCGLCSVPVLISPPPIVGN